MPGRRRSEATGTTPPTRGSRSVGMMLGTFGFRAILDSGRSRHGQTLLQQVARHVSDHCLWVVFWTQRSTKRHNANQERSLGSAAKIRPHGLLMFRPLL